MPGYEASQWYGLPASARDARDIIERLNRETSAAFAEAAMKARFAAISGDPIEERLPFDKLFAEATEKWAKW